MKAVNFVQGRATALRLENLDTDQIMPKQFLRGIDKSGLARGLFHDLRYDGAGQARPGFYMNQPGGEAVKVLLGGANFGCGSSREHAVWGLQQSGIEAVVAPGFGEIFYSNALGNGLLLVVLPPEDVARLMGDAERWPGEEVRIDVQALTVKSHSVDARFGLSARHQRMLLEGLDVLGLSLTYRPAIAAFEQAHHGRAPWLQDVAARMTARLR